MKAIIKISSLLFAGFCFINPANAFVTTDVAEGAARVAATITDVFRGAEKELDRIEQNIYGLRIGTGHKETDALLGKIKDWGTTYAKQRFQKGNPGQKAIPDNQEVINKLEKQLANLEVKSKLATAEQEVALNIYRNNYNKKIKAYEDNNVKLMAALQEDPDNADRYNWEIETNTMNIKLLKSELAEKEKDVMGASSFRNKDLLAEKEEIEWRLERLKEQQARDIKEISGVNLGDPTASLETTAKKNFIAPDEKETAENVDEVRRRRLLERRNAYMSSYADAVMLKQRVTPDLDALDELAGKSNDMDTVGGVIGVDTQIKIKTIEMLMQYAELLVSDLRVEAANEFANFRFYAAKNPDRNITVLDLNDYVYNCEVE